MRKREKQHYWFCIFFVYNGCGYSGSTYALLLGSKNSCLMQYVDLIILLNLELGFVMGSLGFSIIYLVLNLVVWSWDIMSLSSVLVVIFSEEI